MSWEWSPGACTRRQQQRTWTWGKPKRSLWKFRLQSSGGKLQPSAAARGRLQSAACTSGRALLKYSSAALPTVQKTRSWGNAMLAQFWRRLCSCFRWVCFSNKNLVMSHVSNVVENAKKCKLRCKLSANLHFTGWGEDDRTGRPRKATRKTGCGSALWGLPLRLFAADGKTTFPRTANVKCGSAGCGVW